jgi:Protein of unknown function (DUF3383)
MSTIPASQIVQVTPSVLSAGGTGLQGTGLMLDNSSRIPLGTVASFNSAQAVSAYFGAASKQAAEALIYFSGFNGATILPSSLLMAQFPQTAVAAFLRGGSLANMTLAQLQAISGSLNIQIDGYAHNAAALNLSGATSFSNAASLIQTAINAGLTAQGTSTASTIAAGTFSATGSISGNVLTVTAVSVGAVITGATITGTGIAASTVVTGQLSGTAGGIGTYAVNNSQIVASTTVSGSYGLLTVGGTVGGIWAVGETVSGGTTLANTQITQAGTGVGGAGTYYVNLTQAVSSAALSGNPPVATVAFDSTSSAFVVTSGVITGTPSTIAFATGTAAASLALTSATGAVISQGSAPQTPAAYMTALITQNSAWVNFMTIFDPDGGGGSAQKQAFAAWKNTALGGNRFAYFCWDPDANPATTSPATTSLGYILHNNLDTGTVLIWEGQATQDNGLCAFALGWAASINYNQINGRAVLAFRNQAGLTANVTDPITAGNLLANYYNFYGAYGAASASFIWEQTGTVSGPFAWADSFETQVWLNSFFQNQLLTLFNNALSVPFTPTGVGLIQQSCQTVIQQGLAFGAFAPNILTPSQIAQVNAQAGANIATTLQTQGYYLQVIIPSQTVQIARGPWNITFWYIDRNSVQSISLASIMVP